MFKFNHSDLLKFPFQDYHNKVGDELVELSNYHQLYNFQQWMLPQLWGHFSRWRVDPRNPNWQEVCEQNIVDKWQVGVWRAVTQLPRGHLLKNQTKTPKYGALTPFILGAIRESYEIPYSSWNIPVEGQFPLLEQPLLDSIQQPCPKLTPEELLSIREQALVYKTGKNRGQQKNPVSTWSVGELRGTSLWGTTPLQKVMLLQLWLAHPTIRHPLQILSPHDISHIPPPLVSAEVLTTTTQQIQELPWLQL